MCAFTSCALILGESPFFSCSEAFVLCYEYNNIAFCVFGLKFSLARVSQHSLSNTFFFLLLFTTILKHLLAAEINMFSTFSSEVYRGCIAR